MNWKQYIFPASDQQHTDVVERHEDEDVPHCWYHHLVNRYHRSSW